MSLKKEWQFLKDTDAHVNEVEYAKYQSALGTVSGFAALFIWFLWGLSAAWLYRTMSVTGIKSHLMGDVWLFVAVISCLLFALGFAAFVAFGAAMLKKV